MLQSYPVSDIRHTSWTNNYYDYRLVILPTHIGMVRYTYIQNLFKTIALGT